MLIPIGGERLAATTYLPDVIYDGLEIDGFNHVNAWVNVPSGVDVGDVLDKGAKKAIVPLSATRVEELSQYPADRLAIASSSVALADLERFVGHVSVFIVQATTSTESEQAALVSFAKRVQSTLLPTGGICQVVLSVPSADTVFIAQQHKVGIDVAIDVDQLTLEASSSDKLNLGEAFMACVISDRADGLIPTMVVDQSNTALGLVYSSVQSVAESLKIGQGVYQSRSRGLWHKGATSGATQTLVAIDFDCDADTLRFIVQQHGAGFCHLNTRHCFGKSAGLTVLEQTLKQRKANAPAGSYTARLFKDQELLTAKIKEEAEEVCEATEKQDIAWEAADLLYFLMTKCVANDVSLADIEANLDKKARKVSRRPGNAKAKFIAQSGEATKANGKPAEPPKATEQQGAPVKDTSRIQMNSYTFNELDAASRSKLLLRPIINSDDIIARVQPIMKAVREQGDAAILDYTSKFDQVKLSTTCIKAPFPQESMILDAATKAAIDQAYDNIYAFHDAQMDRETLIVETMPGVVCSRFSRPIEKVGLYVPGGTAVLPSSALMLGIPAKVAGCSEIILATPPRKDGSIVPEVMYVAHKIGASMVVTAGGAQAVAALAYGTETIPKVDKICGPGNQYVTAAKMVAQNDTSCLVSIDMPAGPSEVLVVADATSNPAYVASDLLSQAEHGVDSQVVLVAVGLDSEQTKAIENEIHEQASRLPRVDIVRQSIAKSYLVHVDTIEDALAYSNAYAPEHLILHNDNAEGVVRLVNNAGSVFVGPYSPESCGDYASGTNHTLPTYGYSRMYSGVNTHTFLKHITSQQLTADGLNRLGDTVMRLAEVERLEAHRNAVAIRVRDIRKL
ncbi:hypothetical protein BZG36_02590 [Bifiguratus adelaidae]|uniref:Histidine biosynthesis trifunctional protein n=1 Tax=Bifiguratus adelaidae TaxID=1938954 RepID=A0A261Y118_9FUNG|nr:hypothetical protein BZG36_02590 [Bifiguratus adelaidae]